MSLPAVLLSRELLIRYSGLITAEKRLRRVRVRRRARYRYRFIRNRPFDAQNRTGDVPGALLAVTRIQLYGLAEFQKHSGNTCRAKSGSIQWSVDHYRRSYPRLTYLPETGVEPLQGWHFFNGLDDDGAPIWDMSLIEPPVFTDGDQSPDDCQDHEKPCGCIGEFSVSWVAPLGEWLMLYNCGATVQARLARAPWGPWSGPTEIFRPDVDNAWCRYMHAEKSFSCTDHLADADDPIERNGTENGDPYAPYVLFRFTRATPQGERIIFLMSTWNPYQVVVMQTNLTSGQ